MKTEEQQRERQPIRQRARSKRKLNWTNQRGRTEQTEAGSPETKGECPERRPNPSRSLLSAEASGSRDAVGDFSESSSGGVTGAETQER